VPNSEFVDYASCSLFLAKSGGKTTAIADFTIAIGAVGQRNFPGSMQTVEHVR